MNYNVSVTDEEKTAAILSHLSTIAAMLLSAGWLGFVGPLIMWFLYKDRSHYARRAAAGAFNFNIWLWVMNVVAWILAITVIGLPIAIIVWIVIGVLTLWCHIHGALRSSQGKDYKYPATIGILH